MKLYTFGFLFLLLVACQKNTPVNSVRWTANSAELPPANVQNYFKFSESPVKLFGEIIERSSQRIEGAKVEGMFLQKISDVEGHPKFISGTFRDLNINSDDIQKKANQINLDKYKTLEIMKRKHLPLLKAAYIFPPEAVITFEGSKPFYHWDIDYIDHKNASVYSIRVSELYAIENIKRVETCFQERRSLVFPIGPKLSELQEQLMRGLFEDGSLSSSKVNLTSSDGIVVHAENGGFLFGPEDDRFDQVQSFFYVQKALNFAETYWQFTLPFPIKIQLRAGYPEKMNTAFYYKGQVRVGDGDGEFYQSIPRDPSIITHEVMHAVIESLSGMGTEGEAGSLNEGFADFLTATMWDNPLMGHTSYKKAPYKRTVANTITIAEKNGGLYHDSGILSGTFWDIRYSLGPDKTQKLALKTIARLGAQPLFKDLKGATADAMKSMDWPLVDSAKVEEILNNRGW